MTTFINLVLGGLGIGLAVFFITCGGVASWLLFLFVRGWINKR